MKKVLVYPALLLLLFLSCKKGSSDSGSAKYHFTVTIDGKTQSFNRFAHARMYIHSPGSSLQIAGLVDSTGHFPQFGLLLENHALLAADFVDTWMDTAASKYQVQAIYVMTQTDGYSAGTVISERAAQANITRASPQ